MPGQRLQIIITVSEDGRLSVDGHINDLVQAYGLLEIAKTTLKDYHAAQQASAVKPATPEDVRNLVLTQ